MTWQTEITEQVRVQIGDLGDTPTYSNTRIERAMVVGALQVLQEVDLPTAYIIDVAAQSITPDPTALSPKDVNFMNLIALKTSFLIVNSELRSYALSGAFVIDGPSQINMTSIYSNMKSLATALNTQYQHAKVLFQCGRNGQAVSTPSTILNIFPIQDF